MSGPLVQVLVMSAIFASIFLLSQTVMKVAFDGRSRSRAVNRRLKMIKSGVDRADVMGVLKKHEPNASSAPGILARPYEKLRRNLMMAAVPLGMGQLLLAMFGLLAGALMIASVLTFTSGYTFTHGVIQLIVAVAIAASVGLPVMVLGMLAQKRRKKMQEQFPVALDIFVRALRSGHPVSSAMGLLTEEMEDPIGSEFGLVSDEISYGADLIEALDDMAERWDLDDIRMFVTCLAVQSETGGNLAEVLDNLSKVIRERASLYLKVRALSSEGRMTGWMLSILPVAAFVMLFLLNSEFYLQVADDPIFFIGFPMLIGWYLIGVLVIRKMVNLKV